MDDQAVLAKYSQENPWGLLTSIDLKECNPEIIRDADKIKQFVVELCQLLKMKRFGKTTVVNFGEDPRVTGFSMTQLIETSLISGHFANQTNAVYLDIFSCKAYPPHKIARFATNFFQAQEARINITFRY